MIENNPTNVQAAFEMLLEEMVNEGLLKKDSPRGVWEISEKGRSHLKHA